jgi:S1-C subfamily serine protease
LELAQRGAVASHALGLIVVEVTEERALALELHSNRGVVVVAVKPDGIADIYGIQPNDVIIALDHKPIEDLDDFRQATEDLESDDPIHIQLKRGRATFSVEGE